MVAIKGHFDGRVIVPDEPVDLPRNQPLIVHVEAAELGTQPAAEQGTAADLARRMAADAPWAGRTDIGDSAAYARELRRQAERRER